MENFIYYIGFVVVFLGIINLIRMSFFLIGSHIYSLSSHIESRKKTVKQLPVFSVVVPAYNESKNIISCLDSIFNSDYPKGKLEVIVVNDGSVDKTLEILNIYKHRMNFENLQIVTQPNSGKAHALNNGMKHYARGELIMCLDADSYLALDALRKIVSHFGNKKVMAVAANIKIAKTKGLLNLIQSFEYAVCYQMKRAQTLFNIEYIVGGIGSTFRRSILSQIDYYDLDTVTEDIDITMKILRHGNKNVRVVYGSDVIAYTQSVLTIGDLIRQRFRWKWGRYQTFFKNKSMFFANTKGFTRGLTHFYLPFAIFGDIAFLLEPLMILFILFITFKYHELATIISALCVITFYLAMSVISEETFTFGEKLNLLIFAPFMYFLFFVLSFVEYVALVKSLLRLHKLEESLNTGKNTWKPVKRHEQLDYVVQG